MADNRKRNKKHSVLWQLRWYLLFIAEIALVVSALKINKYKRETEASEKANQELAEAVTINTPRRTEENRITENVEEESHDDGSEAVTLADSGGLSSGEFPISVDFDLLLRKNTDCVGWLYCEDTPINLAVMQADNNTYYLGVTFDRIPNGYGTIFLDCNCSRNFKDANNLIFGHDMQNGTMFGTLEKYSSQEYYEAHPCLWLATEYHNYRLDIVAGLLHTDSSPLYATPLSRRATNELVPYAIRNSVFRSDAEYNPDANYVTLSTCSDVYAGARLAIICEMVEVR